ncbi:hypothetical protein DVR12_12270 [Chitinophaga silvatica]|uniref:Cupin domain-containing protein n=1 Tax=Chitinophaga silvatica TaxID=2282649 RepID=A0A3E1YAR9_9BACT|nr:hypothetical protein [Chitinophaga silvatica]RFS22571.1 hypothetical protein DVR12_12270 [Chitinophaga silvatica]
MKETITNPLIKNQVTFIRTARETAGAFTEIEIVLSPGASTLFYYPKFFTETFTILGGELHIEMAGKQPIILYSGTNFKIPPQQLHRFYNPASVAVTFRITVAPGAPGLENALRIICGLVGERLDRGIDAKAGIIPIAIVSQMSGLYFPGTLRLLPSILQLLAKIGKHRGIDKELRTRYCAN